MFCPNHNNWRTPCSQKIELKFGLSSEFSECFDKIPVRILLNVLFPVSRFSKACFNALTLSFIKFWNFVAILALRRMEGCHGNFVISHVKEQEFQSFFTTGWQRQYLYGSLWRRWEEGGSVGDPFPLECIAISKTGWHTLHTAVEPRYTKPLYITKSLV